MFCTHGSCSPRFSAASSGPSAPSMFDEEDDGAAAEEEDAAGSDDDAFVVAKPQVSHFAACLKDKTNRPSNCALCETRTTNHTGLIEFTNLPLNFDLRRRVVLKNVCAGFGERLC